jgi:hypothetical protein
MSKPLAYKIELSNTGRHWMEAPKEGVILSEVEGPLRAGVLNGISKISR